MNKYTPVLSINFNDVETIINEYKSKKDNMVYPIIEELITQLNDKITNRELNTTSNGYFYDSWYFWQKIKYNYIGFKLLYSRESTTITNWDCATILKRELERANKLADITVEVLDGKDSNVMVLINIGLREDGKPFNGNRYAY